MEENLVHPLEPDTSSSRAKRYWLFVFFGAIALGSLAGFLLSRSTPATTSGLSTGGEVIKKTHEVGLPDTKVFRDSAQGTLEAGGINGEGTHKLIREGGPSQTVYLVSSVVDLDQYVGKKIMIRGETIKASKAPWLMDVGYVKILE